MLVFNLFAIWGGVAGDVAVSARIASALLPGLGLLILTFAGLLGFRACAVICYRLGCPLFEGPGLCAAWVSGAWCIRRLSSSRPCVVVCLSCRLVSPSASLRSPLAMAFGREENKSLYIYVTSGATLPTHFLIDVLNIFIVNLFLRATACRVILW